MRSADDIRAVLVERVAGMSRRPGMWAPTGQAMDLEAGNLLDVLHFIDECGPNGQFDRTARYGKLGVVGPFEHVFGKTGRFAAEVASVYAEQFHLAGYLDVERTLAVDDHAALTRSARSRFEELDFRRSEIEAELGPPSFVVDDRIGCYAPPERKAGWVFFDYWTEPVAPAYEPGKGSARWPLNDPGPLLRDVRLPTPDWESGLVLTLFGKYLRWGPGWWLDHRVRPLDESSDAIAAQLRAIRESDPSQAIDGDGRSSRGCSDAPSISKKKINRPDPPSAGAR